MKEELQMVESQRRWKGASHYFTNIRKIHGQRDFTVDWSSESFPIIWSVCVFGLSHLR